jgi:hypothetical protein
LEELPDEVDNALQNFHVLAQPLKLSVLAFEIKFIVERSIQYDEKIGFQ